MVEEKKEEAKIETEVTDEVATPEDNQSSKLVDDAVNAAAEANKAAERLEAANKVTAELQARAALGGQSVGAQPKEEPKRLTDTEYAEAVERGEVNPLMDDGFK